MAQKPVDGSQLDNTTVDAATLSGLSVGVGANNIVQRDGFGSLDADTVGGFTVGIGANDIAQRDGSGNLDADTIGTFSVGTSANNIVQLNSTAQLPAVDGSLLTNMLTASKAASTARATTTVLADDPDLVIAAEANSIYRLETYIDWNQADATMDLKFLYTAPAGSGGHFLYDNIDEVGANAIHQFTSPLSGMPGQVIILSAASGAIHMSLHIVGTIITSGTPGNIAFQWAQNTSSGNNLALFAGSWMTLTKVG